MGSCQSSEAAPAENVPSGTHPPPHSMPRKKPSTDSAGSLQRFSSSGGSDLVSSDDESTAQRLSASRGKTLTHSASAIGLDTMIEDRREVGDLRQNVVHIEVPFGKPIEEVYDGVHNGPVLGSGISGLVRLATHKKTGIKYAVKVLDLALVETPEGLKQLREEIFIMCQLDHPNIVRLEEVYESHSEIYLVQELCLGGELFDRLDEQPDYHYTEAECARLVKQMLSAVRYLHSRGIIHRDLKLENFLFTSTSADSELKMIDFGLSKHFRYGEVQHEAVGTPYTVAPEVIRGSYDERCDIWAIGVIAFLLLSGEPPFGGCGGPEPLMTVRSNILQGAFAFEPADIWDNVSDLAQQFIRDMLVTEPEKRPTAKNAQSHSWLKEWAIRGRAGTDNVLNPNVIKALVNFKEFSDMRKLLCEVLSFTLLPDQIKELRREFEIMDTDGSGEISLAALKQVLMTNAGAGSLGALTEEEVEDIFNAMRVRKTETRIHWHEFIAAGLSQCQVDDRNLRLAFDRLDSDHKGFITLDDIMDLMGSDALQSEDAMRQMWGDSMKAVKCQHARITYDDFLLLMKGQSKDGTHQPAEMETEMNSVNSLLGSSQLYVVPEGDGHASDTSPEKSTVGKKVSLDTPPLVDSMSGDLDASTRTSPQRSGVHSAPSTPAGHKNILEFEEMESPLSIDDDVQASGPGVPGCAASLTPPSSPKRGAADFITPVGDRRTTPDMDDRLATELTLPAISSEARARARPRSRSVDGQGDDPESEQDLHAIADAVRDIIIPETGNMHSKELDAVMKDSSKSALVVNRQLYRAHRQMRLAVLEASKRFEEQQAEHAREIILARREAEGRAEQNLGMIQAGLVMRHGHTKQVSSEAIRSVLRENQTQQQALVEKANKRGGRGRRSRKKTISDMTGMLSSMGQDELTSIAKTASTQSEEISEPKVAKESAPTATESPELPALPEIASDDGQMRGATVPGNFRRTNDPFGREGRYGVMASWDKK